MNAKFSSAAMLVAGVALATHAALAAPQTGFDWQQQRLVAAQQTAAENAYRWQQQEQQRLQQRRLAERQAAEQAKQQRLRERERSRERTGFSGHASNTGAMGGGRMSGKGGH